MCIDITVGDSDKNEFTLVKDFIIDTAPIRSDGRAKTFANRVFIINWRVMWCCDLLESCP